MWKGEKVRNNIGEEYKKEDYSEKSSTINCVVVILDIKTKGKMVEEIRKSIEEYNYGENYIRG